MASSKVKRGKEELRDFYENHYRMQTALHTRNQSIGQQQIQMKIMEYVIFAKIIISSNRPITYVNHNYIHNNATAAAANDLENLISIFSFICIIFSKSAAAIPSTRNYAQTITNK